MLNKKHNLKSGKTKHKKKGFQRENKTGNTPKWERIDGKKTLQYTILMLFFFMKPKQRRKKNEERDKNKETKESKKERHEGRKKGKDKREAEKEKVKKGGGQKG